MTASPLQARDANLPTPLATEALKSSEILAVVAKLGSSAPRRASEEKLYEEYYSFRQHLRDGVTQGPISKKTTLVNLRSTGSGDESRKLCCHIIQKIGGQSKMLPPELPSSGSIGLYLKVVKLDYAPALRLSATIKLGKVKRHSFFLDFNFAAIREIKGHGCRNFAVMTQDNACHISFETSGATSSGFKALENPQITSHVESAIDQDIFQLLNSLRGPIAGRHIDIHIPFVQGVQDEISIAIFADPFGHIPELFTRAAWAMFRTKKGRISLKLQSIVSRYELVLAGHPMQALPAENTFASGDELMVKLGYGTRLDSEESTQALALLCKGRHRLRMWDVGGFAVAAIQLGPFVTLTGDDRLSMPEQSQLRLSFTMADQTQMIYIGMVWESTVDLPGADITLIMEREKPSAFGLIRPDLGHDGMFPIDLRHGHLCRGEQVSVTLEGLENDSLLRRQLDTVHRVAASSLWRKVALNQQLTTSSGRNVLADVPPTDREAAWARVEHMKRSTWNAEQMKVFESLENLIDGVLLVHGPAGTGKTTGEVALAVYLYLCGFHVGVTAPTNEAVDVFLESIVGAFPPQVNNDIEVIRIYPSSRERFGVSKNSIESKDTAGGASKISDAEMVRYILEGASSGKGHAFSGRNHSLQNKVLHRASTRQYSVYKYFKDVDGKDCGKDEPPINMYATLQTFVDLAKKEHIADWSNSDWSACKQSFEFCEADIISKARLICATSASFTDRVVQGNWADPTTSKGVFILSDEATMDKENDAWSAVARGRWEKKVRGFVLLGDHKQLNPVVTTSTHFTEFRSQMELSLFARLMHEGSPSVALRVQNRMHPCLVWFPNERSYGGLLRSRDRVQGQLPSTMKTSLQKTLRCTSLTDEQARLAYIEVKGKKRTSQMTGSSANLENVETVMQILPSLIDLYGDETNKNLLIITPYRRQFLLYKQRLALLVRAGLYSEAQLPRVLTVNSSQGKESFHVILDLVVSSAKSEKSMRFMADEARFNVAITRARQALWLVGGPLKGHGLHYTEVAVLAYKYVLERHGKCHAWKAPDIAFESIPSDLRERRETPQQRL